MAAKHKRRSKKKQAPAPPERAPFWAFAGATLLCLAAIFLLLGGFGTGGMLPVDTFSAAYVVFGWVAYLLPVALVYWGVAKFISDDHRLTFGKFAGMLCILLFSAAFLSASFAAGTTTQQTGPGGTVGDVLSNMAMTALDRVPAASLFLVLTVLAVFFAFAISPKLILGLVTFIFRRRKPQDEDGLTALKARAEATNFTLNEGVPVEHHNVPTTPTPVRLTTLKDTAQKLTASENHEALTTASDPNWRFPSIELLNQKQDKADAGDVKGNAQIIHDTFANFSIEVDMEGANIGPRVTQYTLKPPTGVKLTKITALENNLALDLAAHSIRMEAPIPGQRAVGIEVPNVKSATVRLSSIFMSRVWQDMQSPLTFAIGKDIAGDAVVADLAKMPHILVAGQTGSGKSVMINTILTSLLYRNSPADLKLILVDPKQVELKPYDDVPHLLTPVITEPEKCISALKWAVAEMERRYRTLAEARRRNIEEYNAVKQEEGMPYIIIVIDELADLMMMAARDVEALVVRIAQKARAVGIHLVLATQRPSVDVITGLIKANIPARIAFTTASQVDSRTIIDQIGAEKLLGRGDMLLLTADMPKPKRIQAALIEDAETLKVTDFLREQRLAAYNDEVVSLPVVLNGKGGIVADFGGSDADEDMFRDAVRCVIENRKASTSLLQRRLRIGYGRAARLIEQMEEQGIVGPADGSRPREVLVSSLDAVFGGGDMVAAAPDTSAPDGTL